MENIAIEEAVQKLKKENDFLKYLQLLKIVEPRYIIIIAVADTGAGPYYTKEHAAAMKDLGLEIDMSERYRTPYVAIINKGNVEMEFIPKQIDIPVVIRGKIGDHEVEVYSAGFEYHFGIGMGAYVKIDGANYMRSCRGFNYFVFDEENDDVIDTRGFDTFDMSGSTGKNHGRMKRIEPALKSFVDKFSKKKGGGGKCSTLYA